MALRYVDIIYAAGSGIPRRIIVPDHDDAELEAHPLSPGEARNRILRSDLAIQSGRPDTDAVRASLTAQLGKPIPSGVCAVIDPDGVVVNLIMADPAIDRMNGFTIIASDQAQIGWTWTEKDGFAAPKPSSK